MFGTCQAHNMDNQHKLLEEVIQLDYYSKTKFTVNKQVVQFNTYTDDADKLNNLLHIKGNFVHTLLSFKKKKTKKQKKKKGTRLQFFQVEQILFHATKLKEHQRHEKQKKGQSQLSYTAGTYYTKRDKI